MSSQLDPVDVDHTDTVDRSEFASPGTSGGSMEISSYEGQENSENAVLGPVEEIGIVDETQREGDSTGEDVDSEEEDAPIPRRSVRPKTQPAWMQSGEWKLQNQGHIPSWAVKAQFLASMKDHFPDSYANLCSAIVNIVSTG